MDIEAEIEFRKPKRIEYRVRLNYGEIYSACPGCESLLDREYMAFCDVCGQKLDWRYYYRTRIIKCKLDRKEK